MHPSKSKPLVIRDEIHGDMVFDRILRSVIDHEYFQRLRFIRQLGLAEYVFPCANHSRFQHSLGAAYLAGKYFETFVRSWLVSNFQFEGTVEGTRFHSQRTFACVHEVATHAPSLEFWGQVTALAGMLHDIGHGPWSHTFEMLDLEQDFSEEAKAVPGAAGDYLRDALARGGRFLHEEVSVLYIHRILQDIAARGWQGDAPQFFLPVVALVNRKLARGKFAAAVRKELEAGLEAMGVRGGVDFHSLLGPLISGPFDVDRMDYIQRDGRNSGVSIGGIEWRRIVGKVVPCLAEHPNDRGEPGDVVLISSLKNQHVLDDFIFSLFQMYAQVYLHPKIVGLEESIRLSIQERLEGGKGAPITFARHATLTDDRFRRFLAEELGVPEVEDLLFRKQGARFRVTTYPEDFGLEREMQAQGYTFIQLADRPMMKDSAGVYLFSPLGDRLLLAPWIRVSPVARQFYTVHYSPKIWMRTEEV